MLILPFETDNDEISMAWSFDQGGERQVKTENNHIMGCLLNTATISAAFFVPLSPHLVFEHGSLDSAGSGAGDTGSVGHGE